MVKLVLLCGWEWTGVNAEFVVSCVKDGGSALAGDVNAEGVKSLGDVSANMDKFLLNFKLHTFLSANTSCMLVTMEMDISHNHYRDLMRTLSFNLYSQFQVLFPNLIQHEYHLCNNDFTEVGLPGSTISQVSTTVN